MIKNITLEKMKKKTMIYLEKENQRRKTKILTFLEVIIRNNKQMLTYLVEGALKQMICLMIKSLSLKVHQRHKNQK